MTGADVCNPRPPGVWSSTKSPAAAEDSPKASFPGWGPYANLHLLYIMAFISSDEYPHVAPVLGSWMVQVTPTFLHPSHSCLVAAKHCSGW